MADLLTIRGAARAAGVDDRTVRRWVATGKITATVTPAGKRIDAAELLRIGALLNVPDGAAPVPQMSDAPGQELAALRQEVRHLQERLADALQERDRWYQQAVALPPAAPPREPRRSLWDRIRGR